MRACIIIALIGSLLVVKRHLDFIRSQWQDGGSTASFRLEEESLSVDNDPAPQLPTTEDAPTLPDSDSSTPSQRDRIIVVAKTQQDDTKWVTDELTE